ncbi:MerC mercury resistance protein [Luteibacter rhizovicinus]|uniref:MerC mercury resistance protein n=1 Tax=Luteibacter rhizovicinus TaxID=242606 RepID=A0A4R3YQQ3_9GAMM|nr:MerC domain-containing protein [Luteibacter rhizovicinus]TCV94682.1 MerC mercury resistance protein [Luteibacter rhizovicinus]
MPRYAPSVALDRIAATWAVICAVHCFALPLLLFAIPSLSIALYSFNAPNRGIAMALLRLISLEPWFIGFGLLLSAVAMAHGRRWHRSLYPSLIACSGGVSLVAAWYGRMLAGGWVHIAGVVLGGALLVIGHLVNLRMLRRQGENRGPRVSPPPVSSMETSRQP